MVASTDPLNNQVLELYNLNDDFSQSQNVADRYLTYHLPLTDLPKLSNAETTDQYYEYCSCRACDRLCVDNSAVIERLIHVLVGPLDPQRFHAISKRARLES